MLGSKRIVYEDADEFGGELTKMAEIGLTPRK
jgi:hypothetical protein